MCGIIGILGKTDVQGRIVDGLSRLEYRGYDSAGVAIMSDANVSVSSSHGSPNGLLFCCFGKRDRRRSAKEFGKVRNS